MTSLSRKFTVRRAAKSALAAAATMVAAGLVLSGCASAAPAGPASTGDTTSVETTYGTVSVPAAPKRVVAISYDTPWQLQSLGVKPIATQDYGKWISEFTTSQQAFVKGAATVGSYGELDLEAVAKAAPDLIVGDASEIDKATFTKLSAIAPTAIVSGETRGDWAGITEKLAEVVGKTSVWDAQKATFNAELDRIKTQYATAISGNSWLHMSIGDDAAQFSVQQPTGATGNLLVNVLGVKYGAGVPTKYNDNGYGSYPLEQLGTIADGVTVILHPLNADGSKSENVEAILNNPLFTRLAAAQAGHVYGLATTVTDYATGADWLSEIEKTVLSKL